MLQLLIMGFPVITTHLYELKSQSQTPFSLFSRVPSWTTQTAVSMNQRDKPPSKTKQINGSLIVLGGPGIQKFQKWMGIWMIAAVTGLLW